MTVIAETGAGIPGANTYAAAATVTAYWDERQNRAEYAAWTAATAAAKDGAVIEATSFLDATFGPYYRGVRRGYVQGLLFPRTSAKDDAGYPLPDLPPELVSATCELAGRAVSGRLSVDSAIAGTIKSKSVKAGPVESTTEYSGVTSQEKKFGFVSGLLAPILNGSQPGAPGGNWAWA